MKLNPDCVRDVLLYLEENLKIEEGQKFSHITLHQLKQNLNKYSEEDVLYSVYNLYQIHFIDGNIKNVNDIKMYICEIYNITWSGYQFLNTIRPKSVWKKLQKQEQQN